LRCVAITKTSTNTSMPMGPSLMCTMAMNTATRQDRIPTSISMGMVIINTNISAAIKGKATFLLNN
jgi:hypothetical protein